MGVGRGQGWECWKLRSVGLHFSWPKMISTEILKSVCVKQALNLLHRLSRVWAGRVPRHNRQSQFLGVGNLTLLVNTLMYSTSNNERENKTGELGLFHLQIRKSPLKSRQSRWGVSRKAPLIFLQIILHSLRKRTRHSWKFQAVGCA